MSEHHPSIGPGVTAVSLALSVTLVSSQASAETPDAPGTFEEAVQIHPSVDYRGNFAAPEDVDFYKFTVAAGQDIAVTCSHRANDGLNTYPPVSCNASLMDPEGNEHDSSPSPEDSGESHLSSSGADSGDWRFKVQGTNLSPPTSQFPSHYDFVVTLAGGADNAGPPPQQPSGGGGSMGAGTLLGACVAALVLVRRRQPPGALWLH